MRSNRVSRKKCRPQATSGLDGRLFEPDFARHPQQVDVVAQCADERFALARRPARTFEIIEARDRCGGGFRARVTRLASVGCAVMVGPASAVSSASATASPADAGRRDGGKGIGERAQDLVVAAHASRAGACERMAAFSSAIFRSCSQMPMTCRAGAISSGLIARGILGIVDDGERPWAPARG